MRGFAYIAVAMRRQRSIITGDRDFEHVSSALKIDMQAVRPSVVRSHARAADCGAGMS